jgi:Tol biopolymer transport system component
MKMLNRGRGGEVMPSKHILRSLFLALVAFIASCEDNPPSLLETDASWSPDGSTIAYYRHPVYLDDTSGIWLIDADGTNERFFAEGMQADWSPDGKRLVIATLGWCIYLIDKDGSNFEWLIQDGQSNSPAWSPDGKMIAFKRPFNGGAYLIDLETHEQTAIPGGSDWSPDSKELVYVYLPTGTKFIKALTLEDQSVRDIFITDPDKHGTIVPPPLVPGWG